MIVENISLCLCCTCTSSLCYFISYFLCSFIGYELWLAARCSLKGDDMNTSIFVCPLNGSKITLQKWKWTFITDVFKVSEKKTDFLWENKGEQLVSNTIHNSHNNGTTYRQRSTGCSMFNHTYTVCLNNYRTLTNISLKTNCILNPNLKWSDLLY